MLNLFSRLSPIGIDIDSCFINAAQLSRTSSGWGLVAAGRIPRQDTAEQLPMDAGQAAAMLSTLHRQGFHGKRIVLSLPEDKLRSEVMEMPPRSSGAPIDDIVSAELARLYDYDPDAAEIASWDLPPQVRAKDSTQIFAVACPHATALELMDPFEAARMDVTALEGNSQALMRVCVKRVSSSGISAILSLGYDYALLQIVFSGMIIYKRIIPEAAMKRLESVISNKISIDRQSTEFLLAEANLATGQDSSSGAMPVVNAMIRNFLDLVVQELDAPFSYATHQYGQDTIEKLLIMGSGASIPGTDEYLAEKLQQSVQILRPNDIVACPANMNKSADPALIAPIGLAMYE